MLNEKEFGYIKGEGLKIIIQSNFIDIWTRLEVLTGLKPSGHTHTLTKVSNLIYELLRKKEKENEQQIGNALDKYKSWVFSIYKWSYLEKFRTDSF